jgi:hypothetical protein
MSLPLDGGLKDRVMSAVRRTPSAVRADAQSDARTVLHRSVGLSVGLFLAFDGIRHAIGRPPWFTFTSVAVWAAVAALAARGAWRWSGSFVADSGMQLLTIAFATPALLVAVSLALSRLSPELAAAGPPRAPLPCFALGFVAGLYPLVGTCLSKRASDPLHPMASGAALGAASGAASGVLVDLWCPLSDAAHVLPGHVLPVVALAMLGAVLGHHVLAMRAPLRWRTRTLPTLPTSAGGPVASVRTGFSTIAKRFASCDVTLREGSPVARAPAARRRSRLAPSRAEEGTMAGRPPGER